MSLSAEDSGNADLFTTDIYQDGHEEDRYLEKDLFSAKEAQKSTNPENFNSNSKPESADYPPVLFTQSYDNQTSDCNSRTSLSNSTDPEPDLFTLLSSQNPKYSLEIEKTASESELSPGETVNISQKEYRGVKKEEKVENGLVTADIAIENSTEKRQVEVEKEALNPLLDSLESAEELVDLKTDSTTETLTNKETEISAESLEQAEQEKKESSSPSDEESYPTRLLVIDGHSYAFRSFFALKPDAFRISDGEYTNAVYGFTKQLFKLIKENQPDAIAVAFDRGNQTWRKEEYPEYKEGRKPTPAEFKGQIDKIKKVLAALRIPYMDSQKYEADDILATLAYQASEKNIEVLIASGDRDTFQLIDHNVNVLYPSNRASEGAKRMGALEVEMKYGVTPALYPDLAALVGEKADNLPGVPGVGEKTAAQWLNKYGNLTTLLDNQEKIGGKRGEDLRAHVDNVLRNRRLNRLCTDVELPYQLPELLIQGADHGELEAVFNELKFGATIRSELVGMPLWEKQGRQASSRSGVELPRIQKITSSGQLRAWFKQWDYEEKTSPYDLAIVVNAGSTRPQRSLATHITFYGYGRAAHLDFQKFYPQRDIEAVLLEEIREILDKYADRLCVYAWKDAYHGLKGRQIELPHLLIDVDLLAYLLDPAQSAKGLSGLCERYLSESFQQASEEAKFENTYSDLLGSYGQDISVEQSRAAQVVQKVAAILWSEFQKPDNEHNLHLLEEIERPLQAILIEMEVAGIAACEKYFAQLQAELSEEVEEARKNALEAVGREKLNLSSPKQLQEVLFDTLDLPKTKKTRRGYTTNAEALEWLYEQSGHDFLKYLLRHREKIKLLQNVEGLSKAILAKDGRVHTTFMQTVASTGRLSSKEPNLQNIPTRTPAGMKIRKGFTASAGYEALMSVDYSQVEMRIMAHLSGDESLIEAINAGEDLHRSMAAMVYEISPDEVTQSQRTHIKATSYGLAYGLSAFGLSKQLKIEVGEAKRLMDRYYRRFAKLQDYLEKAVEEARAKGYTESMCGRRRYLPDLSSGERGLRSIAERAALNAPIQGTAADFMKLAMIRVDRALKAENMRSRVLLQIHDELILEMAAGEQERLESLLREAMGGIAKLKNLKVDLPVQIGVGDTWCDAAH